MFGDENQRVDKGAWRFAALGLSMLGAWSSQFALGILHSIFLATTTILIKIVIIFIKSC